MNPRLEVLSEMDSACGLEQDMSSRKGTPIEPHVESVLDASSGISVSRFELGTCREQVNPIPEPGSEKTIRAGLRCGEALCRLMHVPAQMKNRLSGISSNGEPGLLGQANWGKQLGRDPVPWWYKRMHSGSFGGSGM